MQPKHFVGVPSGVVDNNKSSHFREFSVLPRDICKRKIKIPAQKAVTCLKAPGANGKQIILTNVVINFYGAAEHTL